MHQIQKVPQLVLPVSKSKLLPPVAGNVNSVEYLEMFCLNGVVVKYTMKVRNLVAKSIIQSMSYLEHIINEFN